MPRVHVRRARRAYPAEGIAEGQVYYCWSLYRQGRRRSAAYPSRADLTQSPTLAAVYAVFDDPSPLDVPELLRRADALREAHARLLRQNAALVPGLRSGRMIGRLVAAADRIADAALDLQALALKCENAPPQTPAEHEVLRQVFRAMEPELPTFDPPEERR